MKAGKNLSAMDISGKSDPYCIISVGDDEERTTVQYNTVDPKWDASFTFLIYNGPHFRSQGICKYMILFHFHSAWSTCKLYTGLAHHIDRPWKITWKDIIYSFFFNWTALDAELSINIIEITAYDQNISRTEQDMRQLGNMLLTLCSLLATFSILLWLTPEILLCLTPNDFTLSNARRFYSV